MWRRARRRSRATSVRSSRPSSRNIDKSHAPCALFRMPPRRRAAPSSSSSFRAALDRAQLVAKGAERRRHCHAKQIQTPRRHPARPQQRRPDSGSTCATYCHELPPEDAFGEVPLKIAVAVASAAVGAETSCLAFIFTPGRRSPAMRASGGNLSPRISSALTSARLDRGADLSAARWYDDAVAMAADPEIDVGEVKASIQRRGRRQAHDLVETTLARNKQRHQREPTGFTDGRARHRACRRGRRRQEFRWPSRAAVARQHPDHQRRRARGLPATACPAHLRHPRRHDELHPDDDA